MRVQIHKLQVQIHELRAQVHELQVQFLEFRVHHPSPHMTLEKFAFSFAINLRKQNETDFSFTSLTQNFVLCH